MSKAQALAHKKGDIMFLVDFKKPFVELAASLEMQDQQAQARGADLPRPKPQMISNVLSFVIAKSDDQKDPLKMWGWANRLSGIGSLMLDKADKAMLREFVVHNKMLVVESKGQIIEILDSAIETVETPEVPAPQTMKVCEDKKE
jgi:hypothetical protein